MNLLTMSAAGGMIILTAVVIRALAINRLPKSAFLALWVVAAARLLIPISIPSPLSAWTPLAGLGSSAGAGRTTAAAQLSVGAFAQNQAGAGAAWSGAGTAAAHASAQADALPVWFWIWLAGACACALFFTVAYVRSMRVFRESLPVENETVAVWLAQHRLLRSVKVRCSARVSSPLTYGVLRPVLLLPGAMKDAPGEQLRYVLMHEWMHIRRFDALGKLVLAAALCAHWFNPLVWVMWVLCNRDIELSCDERVVKACGGNARRAYALTLICMEERKGAMHPLCSSFSRNAIEERITAIMKTKKGSFISILTAVLLVLATTAAFATSAPVRVASEAEGQAVAGTKSGGRTGVVSESGDARLDRETYRKGYAQYEPYGLSYQASDGRLYYQGRMVRCFEDMYPVDQNNQAGTVCNFPDGEVDVHAVRDLSGPIERNADGSFDPSGVLLGLEADTQAEFDARTAEMKARNDANAQGLVVEERSGNNMEEEHWWTAEAFEQWIEQEKKALQSLADTGARGYTQTDGWFTWTQERVDGTIAQYEEILEQIRAGWRFYMDNELGLMGMMEPAQGDVSFAMSSAENTAAATRQVEDVAPETAEGVTYAISNGNGGSWNGN